MREDLDAVDTECLIGVTEVARRREHDGCGRELRAQAAGTLEMRCETDTRATGTDKSEHPLRP